MHNYSLLFNSSEVIIHKHFQTKHNAYSCGNLISLRPFTYWM